jgi:hypothetical protein
MDTSLSQSGTTSGTDWARQWALQKSEMKTIDLPVKGVFMRIDSGAAFVLDAGKQTFAFGCFWPTAAEK